MTSPEAGDASQWSVHNVVLVRGAYADGSSWSAVIERLHAVGLTATAVQNPLSSFVDDVAHTVRILDLRDEPTILVGHSFAGTVITQGGIDPRVAGLVHVAARAPDAGEDYTALSKRFPEPPANAGLVFKNGFGGLTEKAFLDDFANGVERDRARTLYAMQGRVSETLFHERVSEAAWRTKPSWYAISRNDRTTSPELERFLAKCMGATTVEIDSGHLSLNTHPDQVTQLILEAARAARLTTAHAPGPVACGEPSPRELAEMSIRPYLRRTGLLDPGRDCRGAPR